MTKWCHIFLLFFFFNDTATTEIYTLSLHDALPISRHAAMPRQLSNTTNRSMFAANALRRRRRLLAKLEQLGSDLLHGRSEEHTSELQSPCNLVCRLLLEKKTHTIYIKVRIYIHIII